MQQEIPWKCRKISAGIPYLRIFRIEKRKLLKKLSVSLRGLLGAEDAVAGVAQAGDNVGVLVKLFIHTSHIDVHVGVVVANHLDPFGGSQDIHQLDVLAARSP